MRNKEREREFVGYMCAIEEGLWAKVMKQKGEKKFDEQDDAR